MRTIGVPLQYGGGALSLLIFSVVPAKGRACLWADRGIHAVDTPSPSAIPALVENSIHGLDLLDGGGDCRMCEYYSHIGSVPESEYN